jgi:hypothetical protein
LQKGQGQLPPTGVPRTPSEKRARLTARDYPKDVQKLLIAATRIYYVKIWTFDPFPDDKLQAQWAIDAWDTVSDGLQMPDTGVIRYVSDATLWTTPANEH